MRHSRLRYHVNPVALVYAVAIVSLAGCSTPADPAPGSTIEPISPPATSTIDRSNVGMSEEEMRLLASDLGLEKPPSDAVFERFVSMDEWAQVHANCVNDQGFSAKATLDGGVEYSWPLPDQAIAQHEAIYRCSVRFPIDPRFSVPLDEGKLGVLYDYLTGTLTECLETESYSVEDPPSRQVFVETYYQPQPPSWHPYSSLPAVTPSEWDRLNQVCPQDPPLDELYGDEG